ncbi:MAG: hypothetical protein ABR928_17370, partial [Terracidiphilus sp.]
MLALLFAVPLWAADPRIGSWKLVSAQCTLDPANKLSIIDLQDTVHVVMTGDKRMDFTAGGDGHDTPVAGNPAFDQVELHRGDKRHAEVKEKKGGALVATVREQLSADGSELAITTVIVGHPDQVTVWTRNGNAKPGRDLFAGDWTQDLSKTLMQQGYPVKIEADGNDGVRFSGEFSYTARFDGKPYD